MQTVMFSSPRGGSGKTSLSWLLAQYLSFKDKRIAILDVDFFSFGSKLNIKSGCAKYINDYFTAPLFKEFEIEAYAHKAKMPGINNDILCFITKKNLSNDEIKSMDRSIAGNRTSEHLDSKIYDIIETVEKEEMIDFFFIDMPSFPREPVFSWYEKIHERYNAKSFFITDFNINEIIATLDFICDNKPVNGNGSYKGRAKAKKQLRDNLIKNSNVIVNKYFSQIRLKESLSCAAIGGPCPEICRFYDTIQYLSENDKEYERLTTVFDKFAKAVKNNTLIENPNLLKNELREIVDHDPNIDTDYNNAYSAFRKSNFTYFPKSHGISMSEYLGHKNVSYSNIKDYFENAKRVGEGVARSSTKTCNASDEMEIDSRLEEIALMMSSN